VWTNHTGVTKATESIENRDSIESRTGARLFLAPARRLSQVVETAP
jgi:hypothetical protein